jgi:hypothetical protein
MRFNNLFDWVYLKIAVGKSTCNPYINWVAPEVLLPKGRLAHGTVTRWHCPEALRYGLPTGPFDLELVCNRAGAVDTGNAKGSSLCGATAVSSVAGECSLVGGGVSLIISSCGAAPGLPVDGQGSPLWLAMIEPLQRILNTKNLYLKIPTYLGRTAGIVSSMAVVWNWQGSLHTNYYCAALAESRQVPRAEYCSERIWLPNMAVLRHPLCCPSKLQV